MVRQRWSSRKVFLYAAIGSAVGLGNIWRFPYLTYKFGGGAFLIPYIIALLVIGIPLLILEFAIGQKLQRGPIAAFKNINPRLKGIGVLAIFSGFIVVAYYAVVMAWALIYFIGSLRSKLPWAADSKDFFFTNVLNISDGVGTIGSINPHLFIALLITWILIYFCVWKGVKSVGRVVKWTMPLPIILLIVLFIRGITLEGAFTGISYYLTPNFSALANSEIWLAAASQIFFTLSLGFGIMIAYASYNKDNENITGDAIITSLANSAISLFAGFVVFTVLGHMAVSTGVGIDEVVASGPGLAFVIFPKALSLLPFASLFSALFFLTLLTLGIDSAFSLVEAVNSTLKDKFKNLSYKKTSFYVCLAAFIPGILFTTNAGLYFLDIVDHFVTNFGLVLVGIFECLAIGYVYKSKKLIDYINRVSSFKIGKIFTLLIKLIIPIALLILIIKQFTIEIGANYEGYPSWALAIGWAAVVVPLVIAILIAFRNPSNKATS